MLYCDCFCSEATPFSDRDLLSVSHVDSISYHHHPPALYPSSLPIFDLLYYIVIVMSYMFSLFISKTFTAMGVFVLVLIVFFLYCLRKRNSFCYFHMLFNCCNYTYYKNIKIVLLLLCQVMILFKFVNVYEIAYNQSCHGRLLVII